MPVTNETPFDHRSHYGTTFEADRCDLRGGVRVSNVPEDPAWAMSDMAEFAGWHAANILPELNGFQGYDCIRFQMVSEDVEPFNVFAVSPDEGEMFKVGFIVARGFGQTSLDQLDPIEQKVYRLRFHEPTLDTAPVYYRRHRGDAVRLMHRLNDEKVA